jgi:hypothetical protein
MLTSKEVGKVFVNFKCMLFRTRSMGEMTALAIPPLD